MGLRTEQALGRDRWEGPGRDRWEGQVGGSRVKAGGQEEMVGVRVPGASSVFIDGDLRSAPHPGDGP